MTEATRVPWLIIEDPDIFWRIIADIFGHLYLYHFYTT